MGYKKKKNNERMQAASALLWMLRNLGLSISRPELSAIQLKQRFSEKVTRSGRRPTPGP